MNRRAILGLAAAFVVPQSGCLRGVRSSGDPRGRGTEGLPTRFWLEEASLPESERESVDAIALEELSDEEREIVRTALREGEYAVESRAESPAIERLRGRIEERAGGGLVVYLEREGTYYRVGFAAGDHVVAHPDR